MKIYLSPSDQTGNLYAYGGTNEAAQCRRFADAAQRALERCGFEVKNNQTSDMYARVAESNRWNSDLHVCIHTNAFDGTVSGTRMFAFNTTGSGYKAAQAIFRRLAPITPGSSENLTAQPQTVPAQVAARRTLIQQSVQQGQAVLGYYVTFLKGDGNYVEFAVDPQQYALLTEGITGSLTFQGMQYLGFVKAQ